MSTMTNRSISGVVKPLRNVMLLDDLLERMRADNMGDHRMACFYGWSGYGKTFAASWAQVEHGAISVAADSVTTKKSLLQMFCFELGVKTTGSAPELLQRTREALSRRDCPILIDEADYLMKSGTVTLVRDLYDLSHVPIILIGEEELPQKLRRFEKLNTRMYDWVGVVAADVEDTRVLANHYADGLSIDDAVLERLISETGGKTARLAARLIEFREGCYRRRNKTITLDNYDGFAVRKKEAPLPRPELAPSREPEPIVAFEDTNARRAS